jgi:hypothetical protein
LPTFDNTSSQYDSDNFDFIMHYNLGRFGHYSFGFMLHLSNFSNRHYFDVPTTIQVMFDWLIPTARTSTTLDFHFHCCHHYVCIYNCSNFGRIPNPSTSAGYFTESTMSLFTIYNF